MESRSRVLTRWTENDVNYLKEFYFSVPTSIICQNLNRTDEEIRTKAHRLGIQKDKSLVHADRASRCQLRNKRIYTLNERYFENIDTEHKAYWLGFLWADGCIYKDKRGRCGVKFRLAERDSDVIYKFVSDLETNVPIRRWEKLNENYQDSIGVELYSKMMYDDLISHNVIPNKSYHATHPIGVPLELINHFVRGVLDGDGSVVIYRGRIMVKICGTASFCDWLWSVTSRFIGINSNSYPHKSIYTWTISNKDHIELFYWWLYNIATIYMDRKYHKFLEVF